MNRRELSIDTLGFAFPDTVGVLLEDVHDVVLLQRQEILVLGNMIRNYLICLILNLLLLLLLVITPSVVWRGAIEN